MLKRIRPRLRGNGPWILVSAIGVALLVTPFAVAAGEGRPLDGGARNPSNNASQSLPARDADHRRTCRRTGRASPTSPTTAAARSTAAARAAGGSAANNEPCVRASNLSNGRAFEFATGGTEVGRIDVVATPSAAPFTTNATGVATGLNADQVDGQSATRDRAAERQPLREGQRGGRAGRPARRDRGGQRGAHGDGHLHRRLQRQHLGLRARRDHGGDGDRRRRRDGRARPTRQHDGRTCATRQRGRRRRPTAPFHLTVTC